MTVLSVKKRGPVNDPTFDVQTDLDPAMLSAVGLNLFKKWVDFAMGRTPLNGRSIMHPTGRYASHIRFARTGVASVAIWVPVTKDNPEGGILESGHKRVDLKEYFARGTVFRMHRGDQGDYGSAGYGNAHNAYSLARSPAGNKGAMTRGKKLWASARSHGQSGFARVGLTGWIIPPMAAYSPAGTLVDLLQGGAFHDV